MHEFYSEAQAFRQNFGGHVVLADLSMQMVFNTRVPFGEPLPELPRPRGHAAAPLVLRTGRPAVGDMFWGPIEKKTLVGVAVPVIRAGRTRLLLLSIIETDQFQHRIDEMAFPASWSLALFDGKDEVMAHRSPSPTIPRPNTGSPKPGCWVVRSSVSHWYVVLEIPRAVYRAPVFAAAIGLTSAILTVALISVMGGRMTARRLSRSMASLLETATPDETGLKITEIETVRRMLIASRTRQLLVENEIRELNASLEEKIRKRTAQLEAANKELEAFSYTVSHDLRAPLRAVKGFSRILLEDHGAGLGDEGRRLCTVIKDSARDMGKLIDALLAFSHLGRTEMRLSMVVMEPMVNSIFLELTTPEDRERIDFRPGFMPAAMADPALIRQVWENLLSNALKFSANKQRAAIEIGGERQQGYVTYWIQDNGAGFDMQYENKLFGVFQRLHGEREFGGTGVGLAIVKRIVQRHGGKVWGLGAVDKGAVFYIQLPWQNNHPQ